MQMIRDNYFTAYRSLNLTRDEASSRNNNTGAASGPFPMWGPNNGQ